MAYQANRPKKKPQAKHQKRGFRMISYSYDTGLLQEGLRTGIEALKKIRISLGKEQKKALPALRKSPRDKEYATLFKDVEDAFQSAVKVHRAAVMSIAKLP